MRMGKITVIKRGVWLYAALRNLEKTYDRADREPISLKVMEWVERCFGDHGAQW